MKEIILEILGTISFIISVLSLLIVIFGTIKGIIRFIINEIKTEAKNFTTSNIRIIRVECGSYLLLGLEFLICADIIETVVHPDLKEMALLAGTVIIRILLSFFLNREISELKEE